MLQSGSLGERKEYVWSYERAFDRAYLLLENPSVSLTKCLHHHMDGGYKLALLWCRDKYTQYSVLASLMSVSENDP